MAEKKLSNTKRRQPSGYKLLGKNIVTNISVEERQNVVKIYPKYMTMAENNNQQIAGDLEMLRKCNVNLEENKFENLVSSITTCDDELNRSEFSIRETGSSISSSLSQLSFVLFELGNHSEDFNYGEIKEENNVNLIDWDTELENKVHSNNVISTENTIFNKSVSERYLSQRNIPTVSQFSIKQMTLYNSIKENESINVTQDFDEKNVKKDGRKNAIHSKDCSTLSMYERKDRFKKIREDFYSSNKKHGELENPITSSLVNCNINDIISFEKHALQNDVSLAPHFPNNKATIVDSAEVESVGQTKKNYDNDVKLDSSRNSVQMQDSTATLSVKEGEIKELKETFENLSTCLLNCLETLHGRILKSEQKNNWKSKSLGNVPNYKHNKSNIRGKDTTETLKSDILENSFIRNVKQGMGTVAPLSSVGNSENVPNVISNPESCVCGFCDGNWLDFHSVRKNLSDVDQLKIARISKKKINTLGISESEHLSNNLNATLKKSQSRSKSRKPDLPFSDLSSSVTKENGLIADGAKASINNCRTVHSSKSANKELYENYTSLPEKLNAIKKEKNKECFRRRNKEPKRIKIYHKNRRRDDKEAAKNEFDSKEILFYAFLFVIPSLFCLLLFIYMLIFLSN